MHTVDFWIEKTIKLYEANTGWGDSDEWSNHDFKILSAKIKQRTGVALSHVTLKRVWGKVKYESRPTTHTLNTLVQFLGYENWLDFKLQNSNEAGGILTANQPNENGRGGTFIGGKPGATKKTWIVKVFGLIQSWYF
jgi:hypothetical protein